jgi:hypothetical protein
MGFLDIFHNRTAAERARDRLAERVAEIERAAATTPVSIIADALRTAGRSYGPVGCAAQAVQLVDALRAGGYVIVPTTLTTLAAPTPAPAPKTSKPPTRADVEPVPDDWA